MSEELRRAKSKNLPLAETLTSTSSPADSASSPPGNVAPSGVSIFAATAAAAEDDSTNSSMAITPLKTVGAEGAATTWGGVSGGGEAAGQPSNGPARASSSVQPRAQQEAAGGLLAAARCAAQQPPPPHPYTSMLLHPIYSDYAALHPQFHWFPPHQQQLLLLQQQIMTHQLAQQFSQQQLRQQQQQQQPRYHQATPAAAQSTDQVHHAEAVQQMAVAQQSIIQQQLHQQQVSQQGAPVAAAGSSHPNIQPTDQQSFGQAQNNAQAALQMAITQQSILQQQILQQQLQQQVSQYQQAASAAAYGSQNIHADQAQDAHAAQQVAMAQQAITQQQLLHQQPNLLQADPPMPPVHPFQPNLGARGQADQYVTSLQPPSHQHLQPPTPNVDQFQNHPSLGILPASGIEAIYRADESNYQVPQHEVDGEDEDDDDDDDDYYNLNRPARTLLRLVEEHHWVAALQRITTHPRETHKVGIQGRTPLHVACDHDAPPALIQALLQSWPEGAERVGTSHMNPLHITCSSPHASIEVVNVLLAGCRDSLMITGAKDVDGDTPLHAACRCGAPVDVLVTLLRANPITVTWKDYEGLNPLFRLWVRYFVLVGEQIISNICKPDDLNEELSEAWRKSLLLLSVMHDMEGRNSGERQPSPFRTVHAASSVDCPRCIVRIARVMFPTELMSLDEKGRLPIHIAAAAPVYAVHDLRSEGYNADMLDDEDEDPHQRAVRPRPKKECKYKEPSVIDILLAGEPMTASVRNPDGQLPLHVAIMRGKTLEEGVQALVEAYPEALTTPDRRTNLYPFMLAASVGRGRGDCSTIYALLRAAPDLMHMALSGEPTTLNDASNGDEDMVLELEQKPSARTKPSTGLKSDS